MGMENLSKEQRILRVLRTVLGNIVKETAPRPGVPRALSDDTVADIRDLFGLIAEREAELAEDAGLPRTARPHFADEPQTTHAVKIHRPPKKSN
ncbi:MAG: segregation and condensation protein A [Rhodocyclales bacterium]|nr:segregation and condensation protein A [Rhodocyclales bacterium]